MNDLVRCSMSKLTARQKAARMLASIGGNANTEKQRIARKGNAASAREAKEGKRKEKLLLERSNLRV